MLLVVTTKNEYCEEVNFEQRPDKAKVFETEKNLHFLKNSTAARMARINWAAREDVENEVWEEKKKPKNGEFWYNFQATLQHWWGCLDFLHTRESFDLVFSLSFQAIETKVDTNTTLSGSLCLSLRGIIWAYFWHPGMSPITHRGLLFSKGS